MKNNSLTMAASIVLMLFTCIAAVAQDKIPVSEANSTFFGPNVYVFDPRMAAAGVQKKATEIFQKMETNEFGFERYALLFKPGTYNVTFNVGFYTHVAGLGMSPDDVQINGGVNINAKWADGMALVNFWRTLENFAVTPSSNSPDRRDNGVTRIAVSQASPVRRLHVKGELQLFDWGSKGNVGYASGGFLADSVVDGNVVPGSQQQWLARNSTWSRWQSAVWNTVLVGCQNTPANSFPNPPYTIVDKTPIIREKPFLTIDKAGKYAVFVPALRHNGEGPSWTQGSTAGTSVPLDKFYIARPESADSAKLNAALAEGKDLLFTPGVYKISETLRVTRPDTIIFGLGIPSLASTNGKPVISVADIDGVKICGLIIDAGKTSSASLLDIGPIGSKADHAANPTFLYDLTVRTGGPSEAKNGTGVVINSNDVVIDNIWIWRADHGTGVGWETNPTKTGLLVDGNRVTAYGLFNEHHEGYQTLWNGNEGRVYMYQSEMPYDVPSQAAWMNGKTDGYASYKVGNKVTKHEAWGVGVYCFFRDASVKANSAIEAPSVPGVQFHNLTTIWLDGKLGSEIDHIINELGGKVFMSETTKVIRQTLKEFENSSPSQ